MHKQTIRILPALIGLSLLVGCAGGSSLPGAFVLVLLLGFLTACDALANLPPFNSRTLNDDRFNEALLRALFFSNNGSSSSTPSCTATQNYTQNFDLSAVDPATAGIGFKITGQNSGDRFGQRIAGAGDFNGDGIDDILVSAYAYSTNTGRVYLLFGRGDGVDIDTAGLTTANGIVIDGESGGDQLGNWALGSAGDIDNDGYDDIVVGASDHSGGVGAAYLIFGGPSPTNVSLPPASASVGVKFTGAAGDYAGRATQGLGDVNGDGIDDVAIGSYDGPNYRGRVTVVFGRSGGFGSASVSLASVTGSEGFSVAGAANSDYAGAVVAQVADLNGDGIRDLLMGSSSVDTNGAAYVIYGTAGTRSDIDLSGGVGANGYKVSATGGPFAYSLAGGGDFNGDGLNDFALGAQQYSGNDGRIALLAGDAGALSLGTPTAAQGFVIDGSSAERAGFSLAMGDVNGDGLADLLMGAADGNNGGAGGFSGSAYLVFGQSGIPNTGAVLSSYTGGATGIRLDGSVGSGGLGISSAIADINGDGCSDLLVGQPAASTGYAFVVYGGKAR